MWTMPKKKAGGKKGAKKDDEPAESYSQFQPLQLLPEVEEWVTLDMKVNLSSATTPCGTSLSS